MRKEVNLPKSVLNELAMQAKGNWMKLKPYMEKILVEHAHRSLTRKLKNGKSNSK